MPKTTKSKTEPVNKEEPKIINGIVNCDKLNVRSKPDINSDIMTVISKGDKVRIEPSSNNGWFKVTLKNKTKGYCMKEFISEEK